MGLATLTIPAHSRVVPAPSLRHETNRLLITIILTLETCKATTRLFSQSTDLSVWLQVFAIQFQSHLEFFLDCSHFCSHQMAMEKKALTKIKMNLEFQDFTTHTNLYWVWMEMGGKRERKSERKWNNKREQEKKTMSEGRGKEWKSNGGWMDGWTFQ